MLSKKDKEFLKIEIRKSVAEALTVEMVMEKVRDDKTGQPLAVEKKVTEEVFLPSVLTQVLNFYEGAMRGYQSDLNKNNNKFSDALLKIDAMGQIMLQTEESLKVLANLSDHLKQLGFDDTKKIDYIDGDVEE